jgi:hypothetical protein
MRLPDPIPIPPYDPGKDPTREMVEVLKQNMVIAARPPVYSMGGYRESGLTLGKEVEIVAESFQELSELLGKFDALADQIECTNPAR